MSGSSRSGRLDLARRSNLFIRPVLPTDRPAMEAIAAQVWDGHDYLPSVFDDWLADRDGHFCAALLDGELAGLAKLTRMDEAIWWMEGLRVDPALREQGIGRYLHNHIVGYAQRFAPGILRYSTASENATVTKWAAETGFRQVADVVPYGATAEDLPVAELRILHESESEAIWTFLTQSAYFRGMAQTLEDSWRFPPMTERLIHEKLAQGMVYGLKGNHHRLAGVAVLNDPRNAKQDDETGSRFYVGYLDAVPEMLVPLARSLRSLAFQQGYPRVSVKVLADSATIRALRAAGYELRWDMHVLLFERALSLNADRMAPAGKEASDGTRAGNPNRDDF